VKLLKNVFLFSFITLIFFGSVGISVFEHFCSIDGKEVSFFTKAEDKCEVKQEKKSCCAHEDTDANENFEKPACCSEDFSYIKLNTENHSEILKLKENIKYYKAFSYFSELFPTVYYKEDYIAFCDVDPPSPFGQELIVKYQNFRI
jgi:hypothetical protein